MSDTIRMVSEVLSCISVIMPPVVNTYGARKKKRRGIIKFVLKEAPTSDVFEALKIENIKGTKALADAQKAERKRLRDAQKPVQKAVQKTVQKAVNKPFPPACDSFDTDNAFDKLLSGHNWVSSFQTNPNQSSSSSDVSNLEENGRNQRQPKSFQRKKGNCLKGITKTRVPKLRNKKEDSIFMSSECSYYSLDEVPLGQRLRNNKISLVDKENLDASGLPLSDVSLCASVPCTTSDSTSLDCKVRLCEGKPLSPISPILPPHGSTSTPCEKTAKSFGPLISPLNLYGNDVFSEQRSMEESKDFSSSPERNEDNDNEIPNKCAESNLSVSFNLGGKKSLQTLFETKIDLEKNIMFPPPSPDLFQSASSAPLDAQEGSFVILEEDNHGMAVESKSNVSTSPSILFDSHLKAENTSMRKVQGSDSCPHVTESSVSLSVSESSEKRKSFMIKQSLCPNFTPNAEPPEYSNDVTNTFNSSSNCPAMDRDNQSISEKCEMTTDLCASLSLSIDRSQLHCMDEVTSHLDELRLSSAENLNHHHNSSEKMQSCTEESFVDVWSVTSEFSGRNELKIEQPSSVTTVKPRNLSDTKLYHNNSHANVQTNSLSSLNSTENNVPTNFNCQVVLRRCDSLAPVVPKVTITSEEVETKACDNLNCMVVLERCNIPKQTVRNSFAKFSMSRLSQNYQPSIQPETVFLKPGKQWRRSLSILSRIRLSAGAMSKSVKESISPDTSKLKGKLWESAVHSVVQLQPVTDVSFENCETSISLLSNSPARCSLSYGVKENDQDVVNLDCESNADLIFGRCGQDGPVPFEVYYPPTMKTCTKKIGEGVYGEVFFYSGCANRPPSVIKIIPIEGTTDVNGEPQKKFGEIFSEVCVAQELSKLRKGSENVTSCFNELLGIHCVRGCYPDWLQDLWHEYDDSKGSENDSPEMFQEEQLYIVLELQNGGKDLESFIFSSADQGLAAFKQIALTLAVGEKAIGFEHRDLHWGNVLISSTKQKSINFILDGEPISTASKGIEVSIIDFTLSRITDPCSGRPIYFDLACDDTLFTAEGDYQFDIYRLMKQYCGNKWDVFTPKTNIAWLHYVLDKLCTMARYKNRSSKVHHKALNVLLEMKDSVLLFESVSRFVKCPLFSD
ncbi:Putative serine/threonine-protein kinase haspin-like protein [Frankliniella fusca]|uniref:non-specific serine/threonine protein kinase n=1 Tax=Frankliniella fusca TaxID=407009 RepID=A0AAE1GS94_9NEOP|nr:Putative serine/threonine-protein kinase haspin-like protein [Frankliniella fusca]